MVSGVTAETDAIVSQISIIFLNGYLQIKLLGMEFLRGEGSSTGRWLRIGGQPFCFQNLR